MGLFTRKPSMTIEAFCQDFHDRFFHAKANTIDLKESFFDAAFDLVAEADREFARAERASFLQEMTALRVELFGLAWQLVGRWKVNNLLFCLRETCFTKKYLESIGQSEIWDIMVFYNQCVAHSAGEIFRAGRPRRAWRTKLNASKMDLWSALRQGAEFEPDCIARVLNRLGTHPAWKKGITLEMLTALCIDRLGFTATLDMEAFHRLGGFIYGMYNGAVHALKSAKVVL